MKRKLKNIFISSIYQNAGKTTVSLGLYKVLREKKIRAAFMKPIGQQYVHIGDLNIDKDSYLIGEVFHTAKKFKEMSPVTIGRGYTEEYIFNPHKETLKDSIEKAFQSLSKSKKAIIIEGTGHAGVGSVIDFSNADVAKLLNSKVIIISEGGIGKSIDEIMLNKALFDLKGVEILGVIVNKVLPEKYEKVKRVLSKGLEYKGLRLLGVIPLDPLLSSPTVQDVKDRLNAEVLCGQEKMNKRIKDTIIATMEPDNMIHYLKEGTLVLTSGDRVDNIRVALNVHLARHGIVPPISGIILSGGLIPTPKVLGFLRKSRIPVLLTQEDTYIVAGRIEHMVCKIHKTDKDKIQEAGLLVKQYVDVDAILNSF